jgi:hypothetical protein
MAEQPRYFRDFKEIMSRVGFDSACGISVENIGSLIGEYHFSDDNEVPCQVERGGKRCKEGHKNGWLGRRQDGKEALIGNICGLKYFNANATFVADRKRISRELSIDRHLQRLQMTRGSSAFADELQRTIGRLKTVRLAVADLRERLPAAIASRLQGMAKSGNAGVGVLFRYDDDEDDDGEPIVNWVPEQIGTIAGVVVWEQSNIGNVFQTLHEIRDTLHEAQISREAGERKLKIWADKLDELAICTAKVSNFESALEGFNAPGNLKLLCFLVSNQRDSMAVARMIIDHETGATGAPGSDQRLFNELTAQIRARAGDRSFRIDW